MHTRRRRRWAGVFGATMAISVAVSGCSLLDGSRGSAPPERRAGPVLPQYLTGLPVDDEDVKQLGVFDKALQWDPCALHDPQAAERATGQRGDEITPGTKITECTLRTVDQRDSLVGINLYIRIEAISEAVAGQEDRASVNIDGEHFLKLSSGDSCSFDYPLGEGLGISLSVQPSGGDAPPQAACGVGEKYLTEIARYWGDPPLREQGVTQPSIRATSPCLTIRQAFEHVPALPGAMRTSITRRDPGSCEVVDALPDPRSQLGRSVDRVRIELAVTDDPGKLAEQGSYPGAQIAGRPATVDASDPGEKDPHCTVKVRLADALIDVDLRRPGSQVKAPVLSAQAPTCEQATAVATDAVKAAQS